MIPVEHIQICPVPNCPTCALTAKIMETLGPTDDLGTEVAATRIVVLAHALARTMYGLYRTDGCLDDAEHIAQGLEFIVNTVTSGIARCRENDIGGRA